MKTDYKQAFKHTDLPAYPRLWQGIAQTLPKDVQMQGLLPGEHARKSLDRKESSYSSNGHGALAVQYCLSKDLDTAVEDEMVVVEALLVLDVPPYNIRYALLSFFPHYMSTSHQQRLFYRCP